MRNLSPNALAKIAIKFGTEPISIVEVEWVPGQKGSSWYADRNVASVQGKILEIGSLDDVTPIADITSAMSTSSSANITVKLDDTDGSIKQIMDSYDVHMRVARVWQWFEGLDWSDKFLVFSGLVNSPITWNEHDRTVSFNIISQLEDKEVGFSAEEGDFPWIPKDLVGKAWPMIFGTVLDYPAVAVSNAITGLTEQGIGCVSGNNILGAYGAANTRYIIFWPSTDWPDVRVAIYQISFLQVCQAAYSIAGDILISDNLDPATGRQYLQKAAEIETQINQIQASITIQLAKWELQSSCRDEAAENAFNVAVCQANNQVNKATSTMNSGNGANPVTILGGEDFPQNVGLVLQVGSFYIVGHFEGNLFYITNRYDADAEIAVQKQTSNFTSPCPKLGPSVACQQASTKPNIQYRFEMQVPTGGLEGGFSSFTSKLAMTNYVEEGELAPPDGESAHVDQGGGGGGSASLAQSWADAGSTVSIGTTSYIISITPGTVLAVKAYKRANITPVVNGQISNTPQAHQLVSLPTDYYTIKVVNYGPITATMLELVKPLSAYTNEGWEDTIYITFQSTIGPNIVDILIYLINNYTSFTYDLTSFSSVKTKLQKFPANFPILDRKNILQVLQEIAFQARCALGIRDGVFVIKYLAEEPIVDDIITLSDIDFETGIEINLVPSTESIITRYNVTWHLNWAQDRNSTNQIILRHNVAKYGTKAQNYDFYIYNQPDIVYKIATFWMIRNSNTWKQVKFSTFLQKLNLETFDTVLLQFGNKNYVANENIKAIVTKANYNSDKQTIDFECLVPVKAGQMTKYPFFWPASVSYGTTFPTAQEIAEGWAGGNGIGIGASGILPVGYIPNQPGTIFIGGINVGFGPHSDWGDRHPSDINFSPRSIINIAPSIAVDPGNRPQLNLNLPSLDPVQASVSPYDKLELPPIPLGVFTNTIDLHETLIIDTETDAATTFDTFFKQISTDKYLIGNTEAYWADTEHQNTDAKQFDFKFDDEGDQFGAGTAFLKDD